MLGFQRDFRPCFDFYFIKVFVFLSESMKMLLFYGGIIKVILICCKDYLFLGENIIQSINENF